MRRTVHAVVITFCLALPAGTGEGGTSVELSSRADDIQAITPELFASEFVGKDDELGRRMFFICRGDEIVGTSTAWFDPGSGGGDR
jgi:hypothetical protein